MKKTYYLLLVILSVTVFACKKKDVAASTPATIYGKWKLRAYHHDQVLIGLSQPTDTVDRTDPQTITLNPNGTGQITNSKATLANFTFTVTPGLTADNLTFYTYIAYVNNFPSAPIAPYTAQINALSNLFTYSYRINSTIDGKSYDTYYWEYTKLK